MKIGYDLAFGNVTVSGEPGRGGRLLVLLLERREDALAAVARVRRDVHRDRQARLDARRAVVVKKLIAATPTTSPPSTASDTIPSPAGFRSNHHANSSSVSCVVPTRASSATSDGAPLGRVPDRREAHRVAVPSTLLNARRAYVPGTVSFTEMRSQAPASTSSNVRGGYGSTL